MRALSKRQVEGVVNSLEQLGQIVLAVVEMEQEHLSGLDEDSPAAEELGAQVEMLEASLETLQELKEILAGAVE